MLFYKPLHWRPNTVYKKRSIRRHQKPPVEAAAAARSRRLKLLLEAAARSRPILAGAASLLASPHRTCGCKIGRCTPAPSGQDSGSSGALLPLRSISAVSSVSFPCAAGEPSFPVLRLIVVEGKSYDKEHVHACVAATGSVWLPEPPNIGKPMLNKCCPVQVLHV
jgi:hypothetical protein